jgi:phospholipid/cholesterol/gamma-HCH transport system substrate-binding protein
VTLEAHERRRQWRVGIFVLAALVAFLAIVYALGARARLFEPRYTIHAEFTEVGGLTEGATVRLAGVQIGRVSGVHLPGQPGGKVRVDLSIARRFADRIRRDSVARIETQGLLGDKIVEITVGTAAAPAVAPGETLAARDPLDLGRVIGQGAETVANVAALTEQLGKMAESFNRTRIVEDVAAVTRSARRATEQLERLVTEAERGRGWAHALLYEEPVVLRRLNEVVTATQRLLDRVERGEGAVGVLTSERSTEAARRFVAAMERVARAVEAPDGAEGLLPALLVDPQYRAVLDDVRVLARNLREVSERVAGGRGTLGSLVRDEPDDGGLRRAVRDLEVTVANLKEITEKINEGEGTLGALIADPTVYERLVSILDGAQRSRVLRFLLRGLDRGPREADRP